MKNMLFYTCNVNYVTSVKGDRPITEVPLCDYEVTAVWGPAVTYSLSASDQQNRFRKTESNRNKQAHHKRGSTPKIDFQRFLE